MENYVIFTDSTVDMTPEMIKELDINMVCLKYKIGNDEYVNYPDHRDLDIKTFYQRLRDGETASTAQVTPNDFKEAFVPILEQGQKILYIAFSSGLSGTCDSARMITQELSEKYGENCVVVVDSLAASMGEGLLVYNAVMKKREGLSLTELAKWVEDNRDNLCHWFTVDDLHHLKRGGRVSTTAAVLGSMLNIKPVLCVDKAGHLIPNKKVRGRRQALDELVKKMEAGVTNPSEQVIFISHGDAQEDAEYVAQSVKEKFSPKAVYLNYIGPVIGAHSGPGTIALFYMGANKGD